KDPNAISVGMVLYIPVTPEVIITDTPMPTRTSLPPGTGTPSAQDVRMIINSVISVGDIQAERVFISRTGGGVLLLSGWQLKDEDGNKFTFPNLELFEGGAVNIWTTSGTPTVVDLYWGLPYSVWQAGEMVTLIDDQGNVRATYQIP
ncbi:MAG: lamin tail domain-containing protein, partial [Anaerolineales bacterium]